MFLKFSDNTYMAKEAPQSGVDMFMKASHIWIFPVSSKTAWHVQIRASLQLIQIQVFVNCLMSKLMENQQSAVDKIQCIVKNLSWSILFWQSHATCCAVVTEAVASLAITHLYFVPPTSLSLLKRTLSFPNFNRHLFYFTTTY